MIDLTELSPTDFEERGRDIEASLIITDIDKKVYEEKWYIECKHYEKGVPADKISNAITWVSAEKVDKLLIISSTSNFFI